MPNIKLMEKKRKVFTYALLSTLIGSIFCYYQYILNTSDVVAKRDLAQVELIKDRKYLLKDINANMQDIKDEVVLSSLSQAAKLYLPSYLKELDIDAGVYNRLVSKIKSSNFKTNVIPFLLHSRLMYYDKKNHLDADFRSYILKYFPEANKALSSYHHLFSFDAVIKEKKNENEGEKLALKNRMKFFMSQFLNLYDILFLHDNSGPEISDSQVKSLENSFEKILVQVEPILVESTPEAKEALELLKNDPVRRETITIAISSFLNTFLRKHYEIFSHYIKYKKTMETWLNDKIKEFDDEKNEDIITYLQQQQNKKFAVHLIVDGLQGNLLKGLIGQNEQFLKQILSDHEERFVTRPTKETTTVLANQQIYFLRKSKEDKIDMNNALYLPFFKSLFAQYSNSWATQGISTTPTISVRNLPIVMTGVDVVGKEATGLPNFHYVDRNGVDSPDKKERAYYFFGNDALKLEEITQMHGMKTMFTRLKEQGIYGMACNTNYDKDAIISFDALLSLSIGEKVRDFGEINCLAELSRRIKNEKKLEELRKDLLAQLLDLKRDWKIGLINQISKLKNKAEIYTLVKEIAKTEPMSLPSYIQIYNPWPDHFAHAEGPFSDAIISQTGELNRLDYWLYQVDQIFKKNNLYNRTAFAMAGDHGLTPVYFSLNPEVTVLEKFSKEKNIPLKIKKISSDEGEGPKLNHPTKPESMRGYDVVIASTAGGNYMMDFFLDQTKDSTLWKRQPILKELEQLKTISGHKIDVPKMLLEYLPETLDYLVLRNTTCDAEFSNISIMAKRNNVAYTEIIKRNKNLIWYKPSKGQLLGAAELSHYKNFTAQDKINHAELVDQCITQPKENDINSWCDQNSWRSLFAYTDRPDGVNQLAHLYDTDKAGTVNLFPRLGVGYNTKVPGRHAGETFHEKDAFVAFWGGAINKQAEAVHNVVNGQIAPTLYYFLTGTTDSGFGFQPIKDMFVNDYTNK